jgi:hypothetical protein
MPAGEAAHNSVQPAGLAMQLRYAIWSFSADVQAVSSAVPLVPYVDPVLRGTTGPHSPTLLWTYLHRRTQRQCGRSRYHRSARVEQPGNAPFASLRAHRVHVLCCPPLRALSALSQRPSTRLLSSPKRRPREGGARTVRSARPGCPARWGACPRNRYRLETCTPTSPPHSALNAVTAHASKRGG